MSDQVEALAAKFHDIYQQEAKRQGDVRHKDAYADLPENIKDFDRVLARHVIAETDATIALFAQQVAEHLAKFMAEFQGLEPYLCSTYQPVFERLGKEILSLADPSVLADYVEGATKDSFIAGIRTALIELENAGGEHHLQGGPDVEKFRAALTAHDAALREESKVTRGDVAQCRDDIQNLEADNARLREAVLHLAQSNHGYSPDACSACGTARKLAKPPETQGKETT